MGLSETIKFAIDQAEDTEGGVSLEPSLSFGEGWVVNAGTFTTLSGLEGTATGPLKRNPREEEEDFEKGLIVQLRTIIQILM